MPRGSSRQYEAPFEYVREHVKPDARRRIDGAAYREIVVAVWQTQARPARCLAGRCRDSSSRRGTPSTAFSSGWTPSVLPDDATVVFAREDDYFFGVLHSKVHELWALRQGTQLEDRPRYTPTTCFETFPFPWPPGKEPADDPRVQAIAAAAKDLVEKRDRWLNPEGASEAELKKRTLTNLYNERPTWLDLAHQSSTTPSSTPTPGPTTSPTTRSSNACWR